MPIFEYLCDGCGTKFEKLVRRSEDAALLEILQAKIKPSEVAIDLLS